MKLISLLTFSLLISCCDFISIGSTNKTYITITFDDANESVYENALPIMNEFGFRATNVINTARISHEHYLTWEQVEELEFEYGWETAGHTLHHVNLPEVSLEVAEYEIKNDWQNLVDHNLSHETFVLPFGHATEEQFEIILKYYKNIRTSRDLQMFTPINRKYLGYFAYKTEYQPQNMISRILQGIDNRESLLILGFHTIKENPGGWSTNCKPQDFQEIMQFIYDNNFEVITIKEACEMLSL